MTETGIAGALAAAAPGERRRGWMPVGNMASGAAIALPYIVVKGRRSGPTFWINGQVHGCELNGIFAAIDFANGIDPAAMSGNVVVTPTGTPLGLDARMNRTLQDGNNLDTSFPGRGNGFITERMAYVLFNELKSVRPDLVISMHTQTPERISKTYAVYKQPPGGVAEESLYRFMAAFSPNMACRMDVGTGSGELLGNHAGAIDYQLNAINIPCFMIELGIGQRAEADEIKQGVAAYTECARQLGVLAPIEADLPRTLRRVTRRGHVTANAGGLFRNLCQAGEIVKAGQPIGQTFNLLGEKIEDVVQDRDLMVIAVRVDPVTHSGDTVCYAAFEWDDVLVPKPLV